MTDDAIGVPRAPQLLLLGDVVAVGPLGALPLGPPRQRLVLALLADTGGRAVSTADLIDVLWFSAMPSQPRKNIQVYVANLRRVLRPTAVAIEATPKGYRLGAATRLVDSWSFAEHIGRALDQRGDVQQEVRSIQVALTLWRGRPFADLVDVDGCGALVPTVTHLTELRLLAEERAVSIDLDLRGPAEVLPRIEALVAAEPRREERWRLLILAHHRHGRTAEALATYEGVRRSLEERVGLAPSPALQRLQHLVVREHLVLTPGRAAPASVDVSAESRPMHRSSWRGRDEHVDAVQAALARDGAAAITGLPGIGKTRLAETVVHQMMSVGATPVKTCDLAVSPRDGDVVIAVTEDRFAALEHPGPDRALLVLDHCDGLPAGTVRAIHALRWNAPGLRVLTVARQDLGIPETSVIELGPLGHPSTDDLSASPAVQLLTERVQSGRRSLEFDDTTVAWMAAVCTRLGGNPLAIELVGAGLGALTDIELDRWIASGCVLGSAVPRGRRATDGLRTALTWSCSALRSLERRVLRLVAAMPSGFTVTDVTGALPAEDPVDVTLAVAELVERLLVQARRTHGRTCYDLLAPVRTHALAGAS